MEESLNKLKEQLLLLEWPNVYLFKFIMPSDNQIIARISEMFDTTAEIVMRPSSNGNYTSISIKEVMTTPENVLDIYRKAANIKGVIVL